MQSIGRNNQSSRVHAFAWCVLCLCEPLVCSLTNTFLLSLRRESSLMFITRKRRLIVLMSYWERWEEHLSRRSGQVWHGSRGLGKKMQTAWKKRTLHLPPLPLTHLLPLSLHLVRSLPAPVTPKSVITSLLWCVKMMSPNKQWLELHCFFRRFSKRNNSQNSLSMFRSSQIFSFKWRFKDLNSYFTLSSNTFWMERRRVQKGNSLRFALWVVCWK